MPELEQNTVADICKASKKLLVHADALGELPTPVDHLVDVAGLIPTNEWLLSESKIATAHAEVRKVLRGLRSKVRGTLDRSERTVFVDSGLDPNKQRFVKLHETSHHILPWQQQMRLFADTDLTLSPAIQRAYEQEANQGAAELLFQLDGFSRAARDYPTALSTPIELSQHYGTSIHTSIRRWAEGHDHTLCVLVLDESTMSFEPMRITKKYAIESLAWRAQFGANPFPRSLTPTLMPFLRTLLSPLSIEKEAVWSYPGLDGETRSLLVESFSNTYDRFLLLRVPKKDRFIARRRGPANIVATR